MNIIRDNWGVPHIYGKTDADAVFGLLYAQCEENFNAVEDNFIEMLGRRSELYGPSFFYEDLQMQVLYDTAAAKADYRRSPVWLKKLLDASADGINYYLYKHPEAKPRLLKKFEPWFGLLRTDGSISATQTGSLTLQDIRNLYPADSSVSYYHGPDVAVEDPTGSNGFAVAPALTSSGNAMLYINPHTSFYFRTEVQVVSEEGLNAYGAVTWGTFFVYQGFNENCGWMHTSSYADVADLYAEKTVENEGKYYYEYDGKLQLVKTRKFGFRIAKDSGFTQRQVTVFQTVHGPVLGKRDGRWLALKENNRSMEALMQSWLRTKATGFDDFKRIMNMRANNSNNTVFADNKGNIAYWHGNFIPRRDTKYNYSEIVDGTSSATNWKGMHELDQIVHVYNPKNGWLQNCNSTPFSVCGDQSPKKEDFPEYMAPDGENFRAVNAVRLLSQVKHITLDGLIDSVGYNHRLMAFDYLMQALNSSYTQLPMNDSLRIDVKDVVERMMKWNKEVSLNDPIVPVAIEWGYKVFARSLPLSNYYQQSDAFRQLFLAIGAMNARDMLMLLRDARNELQLKYGNWLLPWGDVNRYQRSIDGKFSDNAKSYPVDLAAGLFGCIPSYNSKQQAGTIRRYGYSGNSFVACVEFGKRIKARSVLTGGQSYDPSSPHYTDQAEIYITGRFKDVLFYKEDVLKHVERTYHPGE